MIFLAEKTFAGLTLLQISLVSLFLLIITMNVIGGWNHGVVRQVFRLVALVLAYLAGATLGPLAASVVPLGALEGAAKITVVSIVVGFGVYLVLRLVINMVFRKTHEQESAVARFFYGSGGALIGLLTSVVFLLLTVVGLRMIGTVAEARARVLAKRGEKPPESMVGAVGNYAIQARQALENGPLALILDTVDPTPKEGYKVLANLASVTSDPEAMHRLGQYPGTQKLAEHPALRALAADAGVMKLVEEKNWLEMLRNPKVSGLFNDKSFQAELKKYEFGKALEFALKPAPAGNNLPAATPALPEEKTEVRRY